MLPKFPAFKTVELSDKADIEAYTNLFEPYSDFNFTSFWSWDTTNERMISEFNHNLVARFTDYNTREKFLSFLGVNETERTARTLIDYCKTEKLPTTLKLIPEISIKGIRQSVIKIEEDRDNFDYIYSIPELSLLRGKKFETKRNLVNRFTRKHPEALVEVIDFNNTNVQGDIISIMEEWEQGKLKNKKTYDEQELVAIKRLCETSNSHNLILLGIFVDALMIAFSINEILPRGVVICHYWKAHNPSPGIYDFLIYKKAKHLETLGMQFLNYEQDLGILSLRAAKNSFRPVQFLKKYTLSLA